MTVLACVAASPAIARSGAAPAGLDPAQSAAWERLAKAQDALTDLQPLDPDYVADEAAWERWRRSNGD